MDKRDFFEVLKSKLLRTPSDNFESTFWAKFDGEFGSGQPRMLTRTRRHWVLRWAAAPVFAIVILLIYTNNPFTKRAELERNARNGEIPFERLIEQAVFIENLELFLGPEELAQTDFTALNEEEWKILLEGNG